MNKRILIVDDSFYMRTMLKNMLTDAGYDVVGEAANGAQALEMATSTNPDLITLDVILPDNTGLDVLKSLRQIQPSAKVVMCSAVGQEVIVTEAIENGALAYIVKPFSEEKVLEIVGAALQAGEHGSGLGHIGGFIQHVVVQAHNGVGGEHHLIGGQVGGVSAGFVGGQVLGYFGPAQVRGKILLDFHQPDFISQAHFSEQLAAAGRVGC